MRDIAGEYFSTRRSDSTKLRLSNLFNERRASVDKDGVLTLENWKDLRGHPVKFRPIGKDLWQAQEDQDRVFAIRDSRNRVVRIAVDFPGVQLQRVPWYENENLLLPAVRPAWGFARWCWWRRCCASAGAYSCGGGRS